MPEEDEIQSIMKEEKSRGVRRKRVDTEERKKTQKTKADIAKVMASGDEREFMKIMREIGIDERRFGQHRRAAETRFYAVPGRSEDRVTRDLRARARGSRNRDEW